MTRKTLLSARFRISAAILAFTVLAALPCRSAAQAGNPLWAQQAELTPTDAGGFFGRSVAIDGNTAVVGAPSAAVGANYSQGAAYIFVNSGGVWTQQAELTAQDGALGDSFGWSVSISGNTVAIGANGHAVNGTANQGAVYIFTNNGGTWTQASEVTAADGAQSDNFGWSVSLNGDSLAVGAPNKTANGIQASGAAYVFAKNGGTWTQQGQLVAADGATGDEFGFSVSGDSSNVIVGAPYKAFNSNAAQGLAYVFTQNNGVWSQYTELIAPDGNTGSGFGYSVSLSGNAAVIGAPNGLGSAPAIGSVYRWELDYGMWTNTVELIASDSVGGNWFGESVSYDSTSGRLAVGAPLTTLNSINSGAAYAFAQIGGSWTQMAEPVAPDSASSDLYGNSVAISGTTILAGAPRHNGTSTSGAAYVSAEVASQLQIVQQPSAGSVNSRIGNVIVQVEDAAGNPLSSSGVPVAITSNPAGVTGTLTVNTSNGSAVFGDLAFSSAGSYTLTVSAPGLGSATGASIQISQISQTITFGGLSSQTLLASPISISASASSGLPVSFASLTSSICTVSGNTVTLVAAGQCTIQASQAGNAVYSAAAPVNQSFQITSALKSQTIKFPALPNKPFGTPAFSISATASSGLPVSIASLTPAVCGVANQVTLLAVGTCSIQATQAGNSVYSAATPITRSFAVTKAAQTIGFPAVPTPSVSTAPIQMNATATSGLPVTFSSSTTGVCTVTAAGAARFNHVGTCTLTAKQGGNANYLAATPVTQSFTVAQGFQYITFPQIPNPSVAPDPVQVVVTSTSGLPLMFTSSTTAVCTVTAKNLIRFLHVGLCSLTANQSGNADYLPANPVTQTNTIQRGAQIIIFPQLPDEEVSPTSIRIGARASSGLLLSVASYTHDRCTFTKQGLLLSHVGTCRVGVWQPGNADYLPASEVIQKINVVPGNQTITFPAIPDQYLDPTKPNQQIPLAATATSGLAVKYTTLTPNVCDLVGNSGNAIVSVALRNAGTCTLEANQPGNADYLAAQPVETLFMIRNP